MTLMMTALIGAVVRQHLYFLMNIFHLKNCETTENNINWMHPIITLFIVTQLVVLAANVYGFAFQ